MKASALKGMPVVSMADGVKVGAVQDLLFEVAPLRVRALELEGRAGSALVPFEAIRSIGTDAITIESAEATQGPATQASPAGLRRWSELHGLAVVSGEGSHLGGVREIDVERETGRATELTAHTGGVLGLGGTSTTVPAAAIRGIGPKVVTVDVPPDPAPSGSATD